MLQNFDQRNLDLIVNVGGHLVHRARAAISPFDSAVQGGDAVWEGLRLYRGRIFRLDEHLARLRLSAMALAFGSVPSDEEITDQLRQTVQANGMTDNVHIRLTLTRGVKITSGMDPRLNQSGPTLIVLAEHTPPGADDAVMLDHRGFVAETNATHIFLVTGGRLAAPTTAACPEGITRAVVLELAAGAGIPHETGDYSLTELYNADEMFVTGTMGGIAPVISLDGRTIGTGKPGPVTLRLTDLLAELTATTGTRSPDVCL